MVSSSIGIYLPELSYLHRIDHELKAFHQYGDILRIDPYIAPNPYKFQEIASSLAYNMCINGDEYNQYADYREIDIVIVDLMQEYSDCMSELADTYNIYSDIHYGFQDAIEKSIDNVVRMTFDVINPIIVNIVLSKLGKIPFSIELSNTNQYSTIVEAYE